MKVVMVEPNKPAYLTEIGSDLKSITGEFKNNFYRFLRG